MARCRVRFQRVGVFVYGLEILLFYNTFINQSQKIAKAAMLGMLLPFCLYLLVFGFTIGVFGVDRDGQRALPYRGIGQGGSSARRIFRAV
ncbi:hypothetical protein EHV15_27210 [Paenibacillus oralis]|uniref:Uncharacterized protein n=1 Tax=Paenibacillus oralis TaxID=2490856 RepID=A0A3P3U7P6_9BACL|nr:GerAB/ArcD/ProY family transporter [Paenibacillus oralis]RRJ66194.1 hypothetical protein EHV15_27210 [Paenibacillus oralis]